MLAQLRHSSGPRVAPPGAVSKEPTVSVTPGSSEPLEGRPQAASRITGWAATLPDTVVTNAELADRLSVTEEWIVERTGVHERRVGGGTRAMATTAARGAMDRAGARPGDIDLLILATTTPEFTVPATAGAVAADLGLTCGAIDLNGACAGFVYAVVAAHGFLGPGCRRVLVVGADALSTITDPTDRGTAVLLGDGAGAVVIEASDARSGLLSWNAGSDGSALDLLECRHGETLRMNGREVFRRAVRSAGDSCTRALDEAGIKPGDVRLFVPHQANGRIITALVDRLGIVEGHTAVVVDRTGNTSSASIPLALDAALDAGPLVDGDVILLTGFGAGMTWATAVLRWGA
jgi:3-oxoacyl-[acyl-carrier-protein] synthase-3